MEPGLFSEVAEVARSLAHDDLGPMHSRSHKYGTKVWFGNAEPPRVHFEAQLMGRKHVDGEKGFAVEVGFHAEERSEELNETVLGYLVKNEKKWRKPLGPEAEAGEFFNASKWRRISEVWIDEDLSAEGVDFEIGARLADYVNAIQPVLSTLPEDE